MGSDILKSPAKKDVADSLAGKKTPQKLSEIGKIETGVSSSTVSSSSIPVARSRSGKSQKHRTPGRTGSSGKSSKRSSKIRTSGSKASSVSSIKRRRSTSKTKKVGRTASQSKKATTGPSKTDVVKSPSKTAISPLSSTKMNAEQDSLEKVLTITKKSAGGGAN